MGPVDCLAILELDNILDTSVDLKKQMLEEDKITVLLLFRVFFTKVRYLYLSKQSILFEAPYRARRKQIPFVTMSCGEESIF